MREETHLSKQDVAVGAVALQLLSALQHHKGVARHVLSGPQSLTQPLAVQRVQAHWNAQAVWPHAETRSGGERCKHRSQMIKLVEGMSSVYSSF